MARPMNDGQTDQNTDNGQTVPKMMKQWTTRDRQCKGITGAFAGAKKRLSHVTDRMTAAFDIANAIGYLHSLGVVYRDLVSRAAKVPLIPVEIMHPVFPFDGSI